MACCKSVRHWLTAAPVTTPHRRGVGQLLCFRYTQAITADSTLSLPTLPTTTGPIYHQCQAGTERSDTAATLRRRLLSRVVAPKWNAAEKTRRTCVERNILLVAATVAGWAANCLAKTKSNCEQRGFTVFSFDQHTSEGAVCRPEKRKLVDKKRNSLKARVAILKVTLTMMIW